MKYFVDVKDISYGTIRDQQHRVPPQRNGDAGLQCPDRAAGCLCLPSRGQREGYGKFEWR